MSANFYPALLINIVMGVLIYFVKYEMINNLFSYQNFLIIILLQLIFLIVYLIILKKLGATWLKDITERMTIK